MAVLLLLLQLLHQFHHLLAQVLHGALQHLPGLGLLAQHRVLANHHLGHGDGHIHRAGHLGPPAPRAVAALQVLQLVEGRRQAVLHHVLVEEVGQPLALLRLAVGIGYPGRLAEHEVLQFLVLLKLALQGCLVPLFPLPLLEHGLGLRHLVDDVLADAVGIERRRLADGAVVGGVADGRQCLYHQPRRVVGVFYGELSPPYGPRGGFCTLGSEQLRQVDGLGARLVLRERVGDGDALAVGQHRQVVLLAVAELVGRSHHLADEQRIVNGQF